MIGALTADHLVEKVETWVDNEVLGDMHVEVIYSDYKDFGGFKFPTRIVQKQGGHPVLDLTVTDAKSNVSLEVAAPEGAPPTTQVISEKIADGAWYLTGGRHHSVALEFVDHLVVVEAPLNEERSNAVIAEVRKSAPGKPVRYLINTPPAVPPPAAVNLYENIERLKLDVDRIVPLHGRIVRLEDLKKTIGK